MDTPMLAERGWCMAGSSSGRSTDTSGCRGGEEGARVILRDTLRPQEACTDDPLTLHPGGDPAVGLGAKPLPADVP